MPKLLSQAAVEAFRREGFYSPVRVMPAAEAQKYRRALEAQPIQSSAECVRKRVRVSAAGRGFRIR